MEKTLVAVTETLPTVIKNTHFNITLAGWPAAVTAIALCCAGVAVYALKIMDPEEVHLEGIPA